MTSFQFDNRNGYPFDSWNALVNHCRDLPKGLWEIKVGKPKRSNPANKFYWKAVIEAFEDYTGYSKQEVHGLLAKRFLSYEKRGKDGKARALVKSTTELNSKEFAEYCRECEKFGMENGLEFTEPPELVEYLKKHNIS